MARRDFRDGVSITPGRVRLEPCPFGRQVNGARLIENGEIALCGLCPGHRPARCVGALAHGMPPNVVGEQPGDFHADGFRIGKGNQNTPSVGEQFPRVPIGCRYDGLSQTEAVGQRA